MNIFDFNGVAKRQEYWAVLIGSIVAFLFVLVGIEAAPLFGLLAFPLLWILLATTVRRLRDAGLNVWWVLVIFIPYVSFVAHIVFGVLATKEEKSELLQE
jgi:uncharacterized membrane protein YhaH (DUF805 family)